MNYLGGGGVEWGVMRCFSLVGNSVAIDVWPGDWYNRTRLLSTLMLLYKLESRAESWEIKWGLLSNSSRHWNSQRGSFLLFFSVDMKRERRRRWNRRRRRRKRVDSFDLVKWWIPTKVVPKTLPRRLSHAFSFFCFWQPCQSSQNQKGDFSVMPFFPFLFLFDIEE